MAKMEGKIAVDNLINILTTLDDLGINKFTGTVNEA